MAVVAALVPRDVVRVTGTDAAGFLQGQISQDVEAVAAGESAWSLVLAPQGKVAAWFRLTRNRDGDSFLIDLDAGFAGALTTRLERFKLRVDATFEVLSGWQMLSVRRDPRAAAHPDARDGPRAVAHPDAPDDLGEVPAELRADVHWPGFEGIDLLGPKVAPPAGLRLADMAEWEAARIRAGWPAMGLELTDRTIPAEIGGLVEASVSFTKGCYTGQELVARIDSRGGNVPRPVRLLEIDGHASVAPGAEIVVEGRAVGEVTSAAADKAAGLTVALGTVHRRVEPPAEAEVAGRRTAVLATPPHLKSV